MRTCELQIKKQWRNLIVTIKKLNSLQKFIRKNKIKYHAIV